MELSKTEGRELLLKAAFNGKSYAQNIYEFWTESLEEAIDALGSQQNVHGPSVYAILTWSNMVSKVKRFVVQEAGINSNIRLEKRKNMMLLIVEDKLALRFKKLDKYSYQTKNNVTKQVVEFKTQALDFGYGTNIACVDAGYRLDSLGLMITEMYFVYPKDLKDFHWALSLHELNVSNPQMSLFEVDEDDVLPVVRVKKNENNNDKDEQKAS